MFLDRISESKISTYEQCPLKYLYNYVKKYKEDSKVPTHHLKFGSYIHKIFELGYEKTSAEELHEIAKDIKDKYIFKQKIDEDKVNSCIQNFMKFNKDLKETIGTELEYLIEVQKGLKFNGIIDRLIKSKEGNYLIVDYKTSKRAATKVDLYNNNQLKGYVYAVSRIYKVPINKITASHFYPITGKFVHCSYSQAQINTYVQKRIDQMWEIRKKKEVDLQCPTQNQFCNWCGYQEICPEFNDPLVIKARLLEREQKPKRKKDPDSKPVITLLIDD